MIPTERKRVIDTFTARETAKASRVLLENTEAYRILNGEKFAPDENAQPTEEMKKWYDEFIEDLFGEPETRENKPFQKTRKPSKR